MANDDAEPPPSGSVTQEHAVRAANELVRSSETKFEFRLLGARYSSRRKCWIVAYDAYHVGEPTGVIDGPALILVGAITGVASFYE
jgi:hypothetical protein